MINDMNVKEMQLLVQNLIKEGGEAGEAKQIKAKSCAAIRIR
jgi:hypothetical protein